MTTELEREGSIHPQNWFQKNKGISEWEIDWESNFHFEKNKRVNFPTDKIHKDTTIQCLLQYPYTTWWSGLHGSYNTIRSVKIQITKDIINH